MYTISYQQLQPLHMSQYTKSLPSQQTDINLATTIINLILTMKSNILNTILTRVMITRSPIPSNIPLPHTLIFMFLHQKSKQRQVSAKRTVYVVPKRDSSLVNLRQTTVDLLHPEP
jgi:hypothetical protein